MPFLRCFPYNYKNKTKENYTLHSKIKQKFYNDKDEITEYALMSNHPHNSKGCFIIFIDVETYGLSTTKDVKPLL